MITLFYESNDEKPIGSQSGRKYADDATMACRSVHKSPIGSFKTKKTTNQITATRGANN